MTFRLIEDELTFKDNYKMRRSHLGKSCKLHFEVSPLKIVKASKQYMYDDLGNEYLDCINNVSHVGHCHPHVVSCGQEQMSKLWTCSGFLSDHLSLYTKRLVETLPDKLCVCYFVNSGSEANDLALRLAKEYTKGEDILCIDHSFLGNLDSLMDISPLKFQISGRSKKDHVHIAACPDTFRGIHRDVENAGLLYALEFKKTLDAAFKNDRKIAAFISEPFLSRVGVYPLPLGYLKLVYRYVREAGGVCIADEVNCGLGRTGDGFWAFSEHDVVPDIITCGKPLGNGHPMAMVITTKEISDSLKEFNSTFGGNPVSCAIGLAVLDVMGNEQLMSSAKFVGRTLLEGFRALQSKHPMLGDIRGKGLIIGVEIVTDKISRKPAREAAEILAYKMKENKVIISNEGADHNIMIITPPMCFTCDNARRVVQVFGKCLHEVESMSCPDALRDVNQEILETKSTQLIIPLDVVSNSRLEPDSDDEPETKRPRYEDLD